MGNLPLLTGENLVHHRAVSLLPRQVRLVAVDWPDAGKALRQARRQIGQSKRSLGLGRHDRS